MPKKFDVAFVDFDETLFHTEDLKNGFLAVVRAYGVSADDFWATIASAENQGRGATYYDYTFEKHVAKLRHKGYGLADTVVSELASVVERAPEFVFPDARDFLDGLRPRAARLVLLSSGNRPFQLAKIEASRLAGSFDDVIVVHDHKETIVDYITEQGKKSALFINDNLQENIRITEVLPSVEVISKINPIKFAVDEYKKSGIRAFKKLSEIFDWVSR